MKAMVSLILTALMIGCINGKSSNPVSISKDSMISDLTSPGIGQSVTTTPSQDSGFDKFISFFLVSELPFELTIGNPNWKDFSNADFDKKEISRKEVLTFLNNHGSNERQEIEAGAYQFYYGYVVKISDNLRGVIYYRTSTDYTGYILAIFKDDKFVNDIFLTGTKGEFDPEAQKEGRITSDGKIEVTEVRLSYRANYDGLPFDAIMVKKVYQISKDGKISQPLNAQEKQVTVFVNKKNKGRVEEVK